MLASAPAPQSTSPCPLTAEVQAALGPAVTTTYARSGVDRDLIPMETAPASTPEIDDLQCGAVCITTVDQPCPTVCKTLVYIYECNTGPGPADGQPDSDGRTRVTSECIDGFKYRVQPRPDETWDSVIDCDDIIVTPVDC